MRRCSALLALVVAVAVATAYLPSYGELTKRIRPRPDDPRPRRRRPGARLARAELRRVAALRPDPAGDARGDDLGRGSALPQPSRRRSDRHRPRDRVGASTSGHRVRAASTITQQLARNIFLTNNRSFGRKIREGDPGARAGAQVHQGPDPRALSQPGLFRRRRLRHRRRVAEILRPRRRPSEPGRSGDHRRAGQGAVQLFADRRRRGRARPRRRRARRRWSRTASSRRRRAAAGRSGERPHPADHQPEQRPLFHRLGAAAARHADRRDERADRRLDDARSGHAGAPPTRRSAPTRPTARRARWSRSTATARCARWSAARIMSSSIYNRATQADAPAGLGVQAVRLSRRARSRA